MRRMRFTAQELYLLAAYSEKKKMYGIPDGFAWLSVEEAASARQQVSDDLLNGGILSMDFDGKISVVPEYQELVSVYCDCMRCLTVNRQSSNGNAENLIYWNYNGQVFQAEADGDQYCFKEIKSTDVVAHIFAESWSSIDIHDDTQLIIPQIALKKAKRTVAKGDSENAKRILRQNGADERTATVLLDGLQEKANYLRLLLMSPNPDNCEEVEESWLNSRRITFSLHKTEVNFRTCTCFAEVSEIDVRQGVIEIVESFLMNE